MTERKEQTNGGSASFRIVKTEVNEKGQITVEKEKSRKLTIATLERLKELEETGYLEIEAGIHDALREGDKIIKREIDGKEIKPKGNKKDKVEIEK